MMLIWILKVGLAVAFTLIDLGNCADGNLLLVRSKIGISALMIVSKRKVAVLVIFFSMYVKPLLRYLFYFYFLSKADSMSMLIMKV